MNAQCLYTQEPQLVAAIRPPGGEFFTTARPKHVMHQAARHRNAATPKRQSRIDAQKRFSTQLIGGGLGSANQVFVAGAEGQLGARLVQKLLQAGFKVIAGVSDEERAQSVIDFASAVELLKKQEAQRLSLREIDLTDESSIKSAIPRSAKVVAVVGDSGGKKSVKLDARAATRLLLAAQENNAAQFVLVSPSGGVSAGGFFGSLFGSGAAGGSGTRPSQLEQDIASSGLSFIIVRTGRTDFQELDFEASNNVQAGAQGTIPNQAKISKNQVAEVVQQALRLADSDVLLEAWASSDAPSASIEDVLLKTLPAAVIEEEEKPEEEDKTPAPPLQLPQLPKPPKPAAAEAAEGPKTPAGLFGGFGTQRIKAGGGGAPPPPPPGSRRGKVRSQKSENGAAPAKPKSRSFSFGKRPAGEKEESSEEELVSYDPASALRGLFAPKKKEDIQADVSPQKARKSAARGIKAAATASQKGPPKGKAKPGTDAEKPKKSFLASIGLGGDTTFVDDDE